MSLIVSNKMTEGQKKELKRLEYLDHWNLTLDEAAQIIEELYEEQRLHRSKLEDWKYVM